MRPMALIYRATVQPSKLDLLTAWLPTRPWYQADPTAELARVTAFRFDDPAGAVGIETMLVSAGDGPTFQVPLTYRETPLDGAERWLIGTTEHSVLGKRWVYDACGDPLYASALATTILTGGHEAEEYVDHDGRLVRRDPSATVRGSGTPGTEVMTVTTITEVTDGDPTVMVTNSVTLSVTRRLDQAPSLPGATLTCTWPGLPTLVTLAYATNG